ncbi:MAG: PQQ-like beta-propeller repeat protein [Lentisphaeraceae bacterium]|nr:PQQ-like beta-propeller repeat protein [Lentisphaeraceae bacterium]
MFIEKWKSEIRLSRVFPTIIGKQIFLIAFDGDYGFLNLDCGSLSIISSLGFKGNISYVSFGDSVFIKDHLNSSIVKIDLRYQSLNESSIISEGFKFRPAVPLLSGSSVEQYIVLGTNDLGVFIKCLENNNELWSKAYTLGGDKTKILDLDENVFILFDSNRNFEIIKKTNGATMSLVALERISKVIQVEAHDSNIYILDKKLLLKYSDNNCVEIDIEIERTFNSFSLFDSKVYLCTWGQVISYDLDDKKEVFRTDICIEGEDNNQQMPPLVTDKHIIIGSNNRYLWILDKFTGEVLDKVEHNDFVYNALAYEDDIISFCLDGTVARYKIN